MMHDTDDYSSISGFNWDALRVKRSDDQMTSSECGQSEMTFISSKEGNQQLSSILGQQISLDEDQTIGQVINIVVVWRKLIEGVMIYDEQSSQPQLKRYSPEHAAQLIGLTKDTLDEYQLQLRLGHRFEFDFTSDFIQTFVNLKTFVKSSKDKIKSENQSRPASTESKQSKQSK